MVENFWNHNRNFLSANASDFHRKLAEIFVEKKPEILSQLKQRSSENNGKDLFKTMVDNFWNKNRNFLSANASDFHRKLAEIFVEKNLRFCHN